MVGRDVEWGEVQGIVLSAYHDKPVTQYYLLQIIDAAAARAWLSDNLHSKTISFDNDRSKHDISLNIAFTLAGLAALGLPEDALATFPWEFRDGMTSPLRRRILHDIGPNDPDGWSWGGKNTDDLHLLVMVYATKHELASSAQELEDGWQRAFHILEKPTVGYRAEDRREHFGFVDGLSQPTIGTTPRSRKLREEGKLDSIVQPGEFVLGYVNERGLLPVSPSVAHVPGSRLPRLTHADRSDSGFPEGTPFPRLDFGCNGSFLVYRQLRQNVYAFAELIERAVKELGDGQARRLSDETDIRRLVAAKIIGRWDDGTSLTLAPNGLPEDSKLSAVNDFGYANEDNYGLRCPIGAHVRRANPRDSRDDDLQQALRRTNRHRLLRRGRIYGQTTFHKGGWHVWDTNDKPDDGIERGLHFIAINASIESQFEFVQQTWMNTPFFGDLVDELDPLIGIPDSDPDRPRPKRRFTVQGAPLNRRFEWEKPLVSVRGGAYFFLPSKAALEFLASDKLIAGVNSANSAKH
jgi:deferrochelatase/peroxidase EfeB